MEKTSVGLKPGNIAFFPPSDAKSAGTVELAGFKAEARGVGEATLDGSIESRPGGLKPHLRSTFSVHDVGKLFAAPRWPALRMEPGGEAEGEAAIERIEPQAVRADFTGGVEGLRFAMRDDAILCDGLTLGASQKIAMDFERRGVHWHAFDLALVCNSVLAAGAKASGLGLRVSVNERSFNWTLQGVSLFGGVAAGAGRLVVNQD
ncbi:MAG: hypothetical protein NTW86_12765, partial [Candidatus Sumerlaeota bacterium]|nr:hypothetical protein [Candidatus Sumerlaeota bacterium]